MLVTKVYINNREIDEIHIQNTGEASFETLKGRYTYVIRRPKGFEGHKFTHRRENGYEPLLREVLRYLYKQRRLKKD